MMNFEGNALILHNPTTLCFRGKCRNIRIFVKQTDLKASCILMWISEQMWRQVQHHIHHYHHIRITTMFAFPVYSTHWQHGSIPSVTVPYLLLPSFTSGSDCTTNQVYSTTQYSSLYTFLLWLWCTGNNIILEYELMLLLLRIFSLYLESNW